MSVTPVARLTYVIILFAILGVATYLPYWWFGVVPYSADYKVSQAEIEQLLAGKDLADYYAEPMPPVFSTPVGVLPVPSPLIAA